MPEIVDGSVAAGGAQITSYNLEYNGGAGNVFVEVAGETTESLLQHITVLTTPGSTYTFRYRIKNVFGFSNSFSPTAEFKSAAAPSPITQLTTELAGRNVLIAWLASSDNYDTTTRFEIQIKSISEVWFDETLTCDGASETILTNNECSIPLTTLQENNFQLVRGSTISVRVAATNSIGTSAFTYLEGV